MKNRTFTRAESPSPGSLYNPWRTQMHGVAVSTLVIAALGVVLLSISTMAALGAFLFAGIGVFTVAVCSFYVAVADRHLQRMSRGEFLVHWVYSPDEWQRFLASPRGLKPVNRLLEPGVGVYTGCICGLAVAYGCLDALHRLPLRENDPYRTLDLFLVFATIGAAAAIGWGVGKVLRARRNKPELHLKPETYIGHDRLYCTGHYFYWGALAPVRAPEVKVLKEDPPVIEFILPKHKSFTRVPILIPKGQLNKAEQVVRQLLEAH